jgi:DivIVA domain-containing protein
MGQLLLFLVVALVVAAIVFGVTVMVSGGDSGLTPIEPDGRAVPLPGDRPLGEDDVVRTKFDTAFRGYRMAQVDQALQRAAYDIGYKGELIGVLEAEVQALRDGRTADADVLRRAREAAIAPPPALPADAPAAAPAKDEAPAGEDVTDSAPAESR